MSETLKEAARLILMGVVSYLLTAGVLDMLLKTYFGTYLSPELLLQISGFVTLVLRTIDKWLHERQAEKNPRTESIQKGFLGLKGLTGF